MKAHLLTNGCESQPRPRRVQAATEDDGGPHSVASDKPGNRQHCDHKRDHGSGGQRVHPSQADSVVALGDDGDRTEGDPYRVIDHRKEKKCR